MTAGCTRVAEAEAAPVGQPGLAALLEDEAHVAGCGECQAKLAGYRRMIAAIGEVSSAAKRRPDHVARALAAAAASTEAAGPAEERETTRGPTRDRWARRMAPLLALAAAIALGWWLRRGVEQEGLTRGGDGGAVDAAVDGVAEGTRFAFEIVTKDRPVLRGDAQLGDTLRVNVRAGSALWVYRNDRELLLVCPRDCRREGADGARGPWVGEVTLDAVGSYQLVWISTEAAPAPRGELERDVTAARAAGATHELRDLTVQ